MCNIAGYSGSKQAAPILLEMIRKQQYYDGDVSTGVATIHEGKIHYRKIVGDVDTIIRETDVLDLPGTARMNFPGTQSDDNWTWRAEKDYISEKLAEKLCRMTKLYDRKKKETAL